MTATLEDLFHKPDLQAVRAAYSAIAAHNLTKGQPVWPMLVAPPGSAKTTILQPLEQFDYVHSVDKLTPNTFLSGQIGQKAGGRRPSLLHRIGDSGIITFPDFSTVLAMKQDDRAAVLADLRRIFDGHLCKEVGTSGEPLEWTGRITCAVAVTPDIDRHYSIFQSLGERFVMIRWHRPGGDNDGEQAALSAMKQDPEEVREYLNFAVNELFEDLPTGDVIVPLPIQKQIAALAEFVVRARTHVARDQRKKLIYMPEAEAPTRLAQQLNQLAKGSARLRRSPDVEKEDVVLVRRVGFDCIPSLRARFIRHCIESNESPEDFRKATLSYVREDLQLLDLLDTSFRLSARALGTLTRAGLNLVHQNSQPNE
jgi:hypothetical protein